MLDDTNGGNASVTITFPYGAFDMTASWPSYNTSKSFFPIRRANTSAPNGGAILGKTLFQEAYVVADLDAKTFALQQTRYTSPQPSENLLTISESLNQSARNNTAANPGEPARHTKLSGGAIAGIVIAIVIVTAIGFIAALYFRRRRKRPTSPPADRKQFDDEKFVNINEVHQAPDANFQELEQPLPELSHNIPELAAPTPELPTSSTPFGPADNK